MAPVPPEDLTEDRPFDPIAKVGEDNETADPAELVGKRIGVALARGVNPHVDVVVAHGAGENEIEPIVADQAKPLVLIGLRHLVLGTGR